MPEEAGDVRELGRIQTDVAAHTGPRVITIMFAIDITISNVSCNSVVHLKQLTENCEEV
jgi:hypothetical protein